MSHALLDGTTCPEWNTAGSVAIAGTGYGGSGVQWLQINLGTTYSVSMVTYYYKAILSGKFGDDIANVSTCVADDAVGCIDCGFSEGRRRRRLLQLHWCPGPARARYQESQLIQQVAFLPYESLWFGSHDGYHDGDAGCSFSYG